MKLGRVLMIAGIGVAAYMAYAVFFKRRDVSDTGGLGTGTGMGTDTGIGADTGITPGNADGQPTGGTNTGVSGSRYTPPPCRADAMTVAFLKRQIESNEDQAQHFENMVRLAREMPLCSTGQANVLGCVENETERQKIIRGAQRERDVFASLAAQNRATLQRAGCL